MFAAPAMALRSTESIIEAQAKYGRHDPRILAADCVCFGARTFGDDGGPYRLGPLMLVADARIDNRADLARSLGRPSSDADDWLLLHAWMKWGEACADRLVGDFAFAISDSRGGTVHLVRDPTGQRPLYMARTPDFTAFASMPSGLLAIGAATGFNREALVRAAEGGLIARAGSYFEGIERVQPGAVTTLTRERTAVKHYYEVPGGIRPSREADDVAAFRALLDEAVEARLCRPEGRVAAHLSSGFDSSAVAATAARLLDEPLLAFTAAPSEWRPATVPRGRIADESEYAALTAELHRMQHNVVRVDTDVLARVRQALELFQEPEIDMVNLGWSTAIAQAAREAGATVLLNGQMGNLTLNAGGLGALSELVRLGRWAAWSREARAATRRSDVSWRGAMFASFGNRLPSALTAPLVRRYLGGASPGSALFVRGGLASPRRSNLPSGSYPARRAQIGNQEFGLMRKGVLASTGIDERDPLSDRRILDFSFTLPPERLLHAGRYKPLAKAALADRVPRAVLEMTLRGYQGADWAYRLNARSAWAIFEEIRDCAAVADLLDLDAVQASLERWPAPEAATVADRFIYRDRLPRALQVGLFVHLHRHDVERSATAR